MAGADELGGADLTADGLAPGQSWAIPVGPVWQARLDRMGRAHVVGRALAEHPGHGPGYLDPRRVFAGGRPGAEEWAMFRIPLPRAMRPRPWHTFKRACRAARMHERMVIAAKRNEGGE
jgi:hypothetical protein